MLRSQSKFFKPDILNVFLQLKKPQSRSELSQLTGIGEGSIRSILKLLKSRQLIESSRKGHYLSDSGFEIYHNLIRSIEIKSIKLKAINSSNQIAILIKKPNREEKSYKLRDIAVKWGAKGALIFKYNGEQLIMPPSDCVDYSENFSKLIEAFEPEKGDYIIVLFNSSKDELIPGALEIASRLSNIIAGFFDML